MEKMNGAESLVRTLLAYSRKQVFRQQVLDVSDALADYYVLLRDIIDLEATYAGPDAKAAPAANEDDGAPVHAANGARPGVKAPPTAPMPTQASSTP